MITITPRIRPWALSVIPVVAIALLAAPTASASAPASSSPSAASGYFWSSDETGTPIEVSSYYVYDSKSSADPSVTLTSGATGQYQATLLGLGNVASKAIVQVTPYDVGATCAVGNWADSTGSLLVDVDCFALTTGAPVNSEFDLIVTRPTKKPHGTFDYAFVSKGKGTLSSESYNSSHKTNKVARPHTGRYVVTLGGPKTKGVTGTVKVSPYGNAAGDCQTAGWHGSSKGEVVEVDCRNQSGAFANRQFMVTYASANNLMGLNGKTDVNVLATSSAAIYRPSIQYDSKAGAKATVIHDDPGAYEIALVGSEGNPANGGDVQVSAVGNRNRHCITGGWSGGQLTPTAYVECYNHKGIAADSHFAMNWVVA